jgi:hypothetical protein
MLLESARDQPLQLHDWSRSKSWPVAVTYAGLLDNSKKGKALSAKFATSFVEVAHDMAIEPDSRW